MKGTYIRNIFASDSELEAVLRHFERLATEEIAAGVAQLLAVNHISQTKAEYLRSNSKADKEGGIGDGKFQLFGKLSSNVFG